MTNHSIEVTTSQSESTHMIFVIRRRQVCTYYVLGLQHRTALVMTEFFFPLKLEKLEKPIEFRRHFVWNVEVT